MKKEFFAALILVLLLGISAFNSCLFKTEGQALQRTVNYSATAASEGDFDTAQRELSSAFSSFRRRAHYLRIFTEDSEFMEIQELFLRLRASLGERRDFESSYLYSALLYKIDAVFNGQSLKLDNIF